MVAGHWGEAFRRLGRPVRTVAGAGRVDRIVPGLDIDATPGPDLPDRLAEALESSARFGLVETSEAIFRPWHVDGLAVRPEHRMVGHTGFLVSARRVDGPWPSSGRVP